MFEHQVARSCRAELPGFLLQFGWCPGQMCHLQVSPPARWGCLCVSTVVSFTVRKRFGVREPRLPTFALAALALGVRPARVLFRSAAQSSHD